MIQIRKGLFETNSSSTHSICISRKPVPETKYPKQIIFTAGEYGWEEDCIDDTASYLYTGILCLERDDILVILKETLESKGIQPVFIKPQASRYGCESYYIDHSCELERFIYDILSNPDKLMRYLLGDSFIYTGNDNIDDTSEALSHSACSVVYSSELRKEIPNKNYKPDLYEYYYKGN